MLASIYTYFATLILAALCQMVATGRVDGALDTLGFGFSFGLFAWWIVSMFVVAPLGTAIAVTLARWQRPARFHGAISAAMTALTLGSVMALIFQERIDAYPEMAVYAFAVGVVACAAGSGAYVQEQILQWPLFEDEH